MYFVYALPVHAMLSSTDLVTSITYTQTSPYLKTLFIYVLPIILVMLGYHYVYVKPQIVSQAPVVCENYAFPLTPMLNYALTPMPLTGLVFAYESSQTMPTTETITHQTYLYSTDLIDNEIQRIHSLANRIDWNEDTLLLPIQSGTSSNFQFKAFTAYKRVGQKIHPVSGVYPEDIKVIRKIPEDPLKSLPALPKHPPKFTPGKRLTEERLKGMEVNKDNFLLPEEEKLFNHILQLNEMTLAFEEQDRGTLRKDYFSD